MKGWLRDAIDQIALAEFLAGSSVSCGQRFGLIAVDNSVEFMLIAYVEVDKQIVGGHKPGGITKANWEQTKRGFEDLLSFVCSIEPNLTPLEKEIIRYHNLRNGVYHTGNPMTVSPSRVRKYSDLSREVLAILFSISFDEKEWDVLVSEVGSGLISSDQSPQIKRSVSYEKEETAIRYSTDRQPTAREAVLLASHGFMVLNGHPPERDQLKKSIALSGYPITSEVLSARVSDLRKNEQIRKSSLQVTAKGLKELQKTYLL